MITSVQAPYQLAELSRAEDHVHVKLQDESHTQLPMTPELEELFGHRDYLYFEAILRDGILTLHKNVSPP